MIKTKIGNITANASGHTQWVDACNRVENREKLWCNDMIAIGYSMVVDDVCCKILKESHGSGVVQWIKDAKLQPGEVLLAFNRFRYYGNPKPGNKAVIGYPTAYWSDVTLLEKTDIYKDIKDCRTEVWKVKLHKKPSILFTEEPNQFFDPRFIPDEYISAFDGNPKNGEIAWSYHKKKVKNLSSRFCKFIMGLFE